MGKILINNNLFGVDVEANPSGTPTEQLNSIMINGVAYNISSGGGGSESLELKYVGDSQGTSRWTVDEEGDYMVIASYSYQGSAYVGWEQSGGINFSITEDSRGCSIDFKHCQQGEYIDVGATASDWSAYLKIIFKLNDIPIPSSRLTGSSSGHDGALSVDSFTGTGDALFIGITCGRTIGYNYFSDFSDYSPDMKFQGIVGVNTILRICYGDVDDFKPMRFFSYDGGYSGIIGLQ